MALLVASGATTFAVSLWVGIALFWDLTLREFVRFVVGSILILVMAVVCLPLTAELALWQVEMLLSSEGATR